VHYAILGYIDEAKWLMLANPDLDIKQIGEIVGYADRHYFSRIFKNGDSILCNAAFAAPLPHLEGIDLLPYDTTVADNYAGLNRPYKLVGTRPLSDERMAKIAAILHENVRAVGVGPAAH
jgi:hypothetical protein